MPDLVPETITVFGIQMHETLLTAILVSIGIIIFALIVRFIVFPRFEEKPRGFQLVMEMVVGMISRFSTNIMGQKGGGIAGYIFALGFLLIISGLVELFGVRAPATDLNFTFAISLITFVLMAAYGIRYKKVKGWLKSYAQPSGIVAPFRVISDCVLPISMACRMFGNLFSGLVVMNMIYGAMGAFAIAVPSFASLYFTIFHVGMQTYVFMMLTLSFVNEKVE